MIEREGSDVLGAREDRGKGGKEASKPSAEVGRKGGAWPHKKNTRRIQMYAWGGPRGSAREKERWDTGGLTANNDHTGGVEGLSGPRRGRVPQIDAEFRTSVRVYPRSDAGESSLQSSGSVQHVVVNYPTVEQEHLPRTNGHAVAQYYVVVLEVPEVASAEW